MSHTAALSGGELALVRLVRHLGDEVRVHVVVGEDGPLVGALVAAGATVEVAPLAPRSRELRRGSLDLRRLPLLPVVDAVRYAMQLSFRLRNLQPDVVHTNTLKAAVYGGVAARLAGRPCLWHIRDRISPDYLPRPAVTLIRLLARIVPAVVVTDTRAVLATVGPAAGKGYVVPSLIEPAAVGVRNPSPGKGFRMTMVGRLAPWKGQHVFLRAFARAFPAGAESASIVGDALFGEDDYRRELGELCRTLGVLDRVEFRGFRSDIGPELATADVVVHASIIPEPFGQVVLEAMAAGVPVVASAAGGPAEVIKDGHNGLLTPPADVEALAAALRRLANQPELRNRLAEAGKETARRYAPEIVVPEMVGLYRAVAGQGA